MSFLAANSGSRARLPTAVSVKLFIVIAPYCRGWGPGKSAVSLFRRPLIGIAIPRLFVQKCGTLSSPSRQRAPARVWLQQVLGGGRNGNVVGTHTRRCHGRGVSRRTKRLHHRTPVLPAPGPGGGAAGASLDAAAGVARGAALQSRGRTRFRQGAGTGRATVRRGLRYGHRSVLQFSLRRAHFRSYTGSIMF